MSPDPEISWQQQQNCKKHVANSSGQFCFAGPRSRWHSACSHPSDEACVTGSNDGQAGDMLSFAILYQVRDWLLFKAIAVNGASVDKCVWTEPGQKVTYSYLTHFQKGVDIVLCENHLEVH